VLTRTREDVKSTKCEPSAEEAATVALVCAARERDLPLTGSLLGCGNSSPKMCWRRL